MGGAWQLALRVIPRPAVPIEPARVSDDIRRIWIQRLFRRTFLFTDRARRSSLLTFSSGCFLSTRAIRWFSGEPVLAFNLAHFASYVLNAVAMYWAARSITGSAQGGLVAGAIYAFGSIQVNYAFHSQLLAAWWLPIAIGLSMRFVRTFESRWFALAVLMVWAQFATSVHLGVLAAVAVFVFAVPQVAYRVVRRRDWQLALKLLAIGSIVSAPFLPLVIGYRTYASIWAAERTLADVHPWSAQLSDYLSPSNRLPLHVGLRDAFATAGFERRLFPGFVPLALGAFGLVAAALPRLKIACNLQRTALAAAALAFVGALLSLGPHWKWGRYKYLDSTAVFGSL